MAPEERPVCGIVMPISAIDGMEESHWLDVQAIITDAASSAGFEANLVSNADDVGVIQKRIVQNLYTNPIVICDVSGKNPNVMFELGMRLAFDKPTIIIKDDKTSYSFDTSPIEHITYPRDLRFSRIVEFKIKLASKITATVNSSGDENYSPFLKHFGEFKVAKIDTKEVTGQELIFEELRSLRKIVETQHRLQEVAMKEVGFSGVSEHLILTFDDLSNHHLEKLADRVRMLPGITRVKPKFDSNMGPALLVYTAGLSATTRNNLKSVVSKIAETIVNQTA